MEGIGTAVVGSVQLRLCRLWHVNSAHQLAWCHPKLARPVVALVARCLGTIGVALFSCKFTGIDPHNHCKDVHKALGKYG